MYFFSKIGKMPGIKKEVISLLSAGKSIKEIVDYFSSRGFSRAEVEQAVIYVKNFVLLKNYVKKSIEQGFREKDIRNLLSKTEWPSDITKDVFNSI